MNAFLTRATTTDLPPYGVQIPVVLETSTTRRVRSSTTMTMRPRSQASESIASLCLECQHFTQRSWIFVDALHAHEMHGALPGLFSHYACFQRVPQTSRQLSILHLACDLTNLCHGGRLPEALAGPSESQLPAYVPQEYAETNTHLSSCPQEQFPRAAFTCRFSLKLSKLRRAASMP
ncbi:hypothetical protein BV25DRAFT_872751 [Artomyces pyxidatus]|uniref:Uncharacterized protein n=1 Tax=Artomyces pyxidatus TaxID=48021 RepID=A0ACB8THE3_9AGAM|nr:hypothetical protein BV25DRAFT_872751 [Artomyces pyxidatus]